LFIKTNVANFNDVDSLIERTVEIFGRLDIMFNNACIGKAAQLLQHNSENDYDPVV